MRIYGIKCYQLNKDNGKEMMTSSFSHQALCARGFSSNFCTPHKPALYKTRLPTASLSLEEPQVSTAAPAPKRFSHLSDLRSQLISSPSAENIPLILEPWLPLLTAQEWNVLIEDVGLKSWTNSLQIFHTFTQSSCIWQNLTHRNEASGESTLAVLKICTSLVRVLSKKQRKEELEAIRERMKHAHIVPDTAFYNALFMSYAEQGYSSELSGGLLQMEAASIKPDYLTYEALITAYLQGEAPDLDKATSIVKDTIKKGLLVKAITFRKLINAYWEAENIDGAEDIFTSMQNAGYPPDLKVITKLMQLHGRQGNYKRNLELFTLLGKLGIEQKDTAYVFLLHAYCKAGLTKKACETFESFETGAGCKPSLVAFNMIIDACGQQGLHEEALQYYGKLCSSSLEENVVSYCSIISAMVKVGRFKKAEQLYKRMLTKEIQPNLHIYLTMIHCYTKCKAIRLGHELYFALKKTKLKITESAYSTILALYIEGGWYDHAARILKQLEKAGYSLDTAALSLLIRTFGKMDDNMVPLAKGVEASQFGVCKFLVSLSLTRKGSVKMDSSGHKLVADFLDGFKDGGKDASGTVYNALLDCFWQRGLKRTAQVLLEKARGVCAVNTCPQVRGKEWILDVRGLSVGGSKVAVADWLNRVNELLTKGVSDNKQMVIVTGMGGYIPQVLENEDEKGQFKGIKGALLEMLQGLESPFVESLENSAKLQASSKEVSKWISGATSKQYLSLVDCC